MKTNKLLIALSLLALLLLTYCGVKPASVIRVPSGAQAGELTGLKACEFQPPDSKAKYAAECGTLVVRENWSNTDSHLIALPIVRIPTRGPNSTEPVFWLVGGPGGSNLTWAPPDWLLKNHDVVMVGYRGAEGSMVLSCPEVNRLLKAHTGKDLFSDQARTEYATATKQCAASYQEAGIDLSGYTIPGVVEDLEAARIELGYDRINLFSESYGTRVAQVYAYMHPDSLRRIVLIGVNTPGHFIWNPSVLDEMVGYLSKLCAQDAGCSSRTNDFAQTMYDVNHNMPRRWLFFNIDPDSIRFGTHVLLFSNPNIPMVFDSYLAAADGDPSAFAIFNLVGPMMIPTDQWILGEYFNKGGTTDLENYGGIETIRLGNSIMGAPFAEFLWPMAEQWPSELIPKELREFQESNVEMLLVNGTVDFSTPPNALDEARDYYHEAQMVLLPEFSHVEDVYTLQPEAFKRLITSYYDTGVADSSLFVYQPLSFEPSLKLTMVAKLLVAAMVVLPALIILGVAFLVHRVRRRATRS